MSAFEWQLRGLSGHSVSCRWRDADRSTAARFVSEEQVMDCVAFLFCFCSLVMHVIVSSNPWQPPCHQSNFLEGKTLGGRAVSQALKDCRSSDACCRVLQDSAGFGRQSCLGEMLGSPATPGPGLSAQGRGRHRLLPLGLGACRRRAPSGAAAAWSSLELPFGT